MTDMPKLSTKTWRSVRCGGLLSVSLAAMALHNPAAAMVRYDPVAKVFRITEGHSEYAIGIYQNGYIRPVYWGKNLDSAAPLTLPLLPPSPVSEAMGPPSSVTAQEYAGQGGSIAAEPGIKVAFLDGNRDLVLKYRSHRSVGDTLTIELADISRPFTVSFRYTVDPSTGVRSWWMSEGFTLSLRGDFRGLALVLEG